MITYSMSHMARIGMYARIHHIMSNACDALYPKVHYKWSMHDPIEEYHHKPLMLYIIVICDKGQVLIVKNATKVISELQFNSLSLTYIYIYSCTFWLDDVWYML